MLLEGKNAVITGARRGIGWATVERFAREGCNVWACARSKDEDFERRLARLAQACGTWARAVYFDMTDGAAMMRAVKEIRSSRESVDVLVNNAGRMADPSSFPMTPIQQFKDVFEVNFFAQVSMMQYVLRIMARQKSGSIVNVASVAGIDSVPGQTEYGSSKAALILATKKISAECGRMGVRVNAVAPGVIRTDMGARVPDEVSARMAGASALGRIGEPEEVASVIAFLASDMSSYVTGQVVRIDGGC